MVGIRRKSLDPALMLCASIVVVLTACSTEADGVVPDKQRLPGHLIGVDDLILGESRSELDDRVVLDDVDDDSENGGTEPSDRYYRVVKDNPMIAGVTYSIWNDEVVFVGAAIKPIPISMMLRLRDSLIAHYGAPMTDAYDAGSQVVNWSVGDTMDVALVYDPHPNKAVLGDSTVGGINWTITGGSRK